jgi:cytochrome c-type biogenesis protein CcmE
MANGSFEASRVLAKHDENYMSVEVKAALDAAERDRALPPAETEGAADGS